jgi:hypothetical protein
MAWAIFHGKGVENRSWPTSYRGRIIIHAALSWNKEHYKWLVDNQVRLGISVPLEYEFFYGSLMFQSQCLIGEVDIVDCVTKSDSPWFFGPYGFVLANAVEYKKPIPYRGRLKLFDVPDSIVHS